MTIYLNYDLSKPLMSENLDEENFDGDDCLDVGALADNSGPKVEVKDSPEVEQYISSGDEQEVEGVHGKVGLEHAASVERKDQHEVEKAADNCYNVAVDRAEADE